MRAGLRKAIILENQMFGVFACLKFGSELAYCDSFATHLILQASNLTAG